MRIPIPRVERTQALNAGSQPPLMQAPSMGGMIQAGQMIERAGEIRQAQADRAADEREQNALRIENEQRKARALERASQARLDWTETLQKRQNEAPAGADGFTRSVLGDFDTYRQNATKDIADEEERRMTDGLLAGVREHIQSSALHFESGARRANRIRILSDGSEVDGKVVAADPSQFRDVLALRLAAINTATDLTAEERATLADKARNGLAYQAALTLTDRSPDAVLELTGMSGKKASKTGKPLPFDSTKAAEAVKSDPILSNLTPENLRNIVDRASLLKSQRDAATEAEREREARRAEAAAVQRDRAATQAFTVLQSRLMSGIRTEPGENAALVGAIQGTPYAAEYQRLASQQASRTATAMLPLDVQRQQIDHLVQRRNTQGTNQPLEDEIKFRRETYFAAQSVYKDSPIRAVQQYGLANVPPIDTSSIDGIVNGLAARVPVADMARQQTGVAASPLLPEEVPHLVQKVNALPAPQRAETLAKISARLPAQQAQALAWQMASTEGDGKQLGVLMALGSQRTTNGRLSMELGMKGLEAIKGKTIKEDTTTEGWRPQIGKQLEGVFTNPQQTQLVSEAARLILAGIAAEQGGSTSGEDAKRAVRLAIGGPIRLHNGARIPIPAGLDLKDVQRAVSTMDPQSIARQSTDGMVYLSGRPMPAADFAKALPDAKLQYAGRGRYYVQAGGSLAANSQGSPIVIEVGDAR